MIENGHRDAQGIVLHSDCYIFCQLSEWQKMLWNYLLNCGVFFHPHVVTMTEKEYSFVEQIIMFWSLLMFTMGDNAFLYSMAVHDCRSIHEIVFGHLCFIITDNGYMLSRNDWYFLLTCGVTKTENEYSCVEQLWRFWWLAMFTMTKNGHTGAEEIVRYLVTCAVVQLQWGRTDFAVLIFLCC